MQQQRSACGAWRRAKGNGDRLDGIDDDGPPGGRLRALALPAPIAGMYARGLRHRFFCFNLLTTQTIIGWNLNLILQFFLGRPTLKGNVDAIPIRG